MVGGWGDPGAFVVTGGGVGTWRQAGPATSAVTGLALYSTDLHSSAALEDPRQPEALIAGVPDDGPARSDEHDSVMEDALQAPNVNQASGRKNCGHCGRELAGVAVMFPGTPPVCGRADCLGWARVLQTTAEGLRPAA